MVDLIEGIRASDLAANLNRIRDEIRDAGRDPATVEILAAVKYLPDSAIDELASGGVSLVGENRAQQLGARAPGHPELTWDFIGVLQSRKVAQIVPHVRYIHSVATDSALAQLARHGTPDTKILVEVNVAGDSGKSGIRPEELAPFIERSPVEVVGLMTMPPLGVGSDLNRRHFEALRELAERNQLAELSMGTSQDYLSAVAEGATIIRLGTTLFRHSE